MMAGRSVGVQTLAQLSEYNWGETGSAIRNDDLQQLCMLGQQFQASKKYQWSVTRQRQRRARTYFEEM